MADLSTADLATPVLLRLLRQMSLPSELIGRFHVVEPSEAESLLRRAPRDTSVYVSPLLERSHGWDRAGGFRRIQGRWRLEPGSLDRLRASLALDLVSRGDQSSSNIPS